MGAAYRQLLDTDQTHEADDVFDTLTDGEDEAKQEFLQLCSDTYDEIFRKVANPSRRILGVYYVSPDSSWSFFQQMSEAAYKDIDPSIRDRWILWEKHYRDLVARNPRLELRDMMQGISESNDSSSWPFGYESAIKDWVDSGDYTSPPFYAREGWITPAFFERLRVLRVMLKGWLYRDEISLKYVFLADCKVANSNDKEAAK